MTLLGCQAFFLLNYIGGQLRGVGLKLLGQVKIAQITNGCILLHEVCLLNLDGLSELKSYIGEVC